MNLFANIYRGRRVLITGHTGFKGSWLSLWLSELGAEVTGVSLSPETGPNHWELLNLSLDDTRCDIRNIAAIRKVMKEKKPEIVFHLAAQPLVRRSYRNPLETWSTNVIGTANILEAIRHTSSVQAVVVVTTDKCYEDLHLLRGYREDDRLGGYDPYSASKAASELVTASYRKAFFDTADGPFLATARAGNVVGGGDWSEDRLIPDLIRAINKKGSLEIRSPNATRPWQHVLESLSGYLVLGQKLLTGCGELVGPWNFGPDAKDHISVLHLLRNLNRTWSDMRWHVTERPQLHEAKFLYLDSAKAKAELHWQPIWKIESTLTKTADWYNCWLQEGEIISQKQLAEYLVDAENSNINWTAP